MIRLTAAIPRSMNTQRSFPRSIVAANEVETYAIGQLETVVADFTGGFSHSAPVSMPPERVAHH